MNQPCDHDYENPKRIGRAHYVCLKCGTDISYEVMFIAEVAERLREMEKAGIMSKT